MHGLGAEEITRIHQLWEEVSPLRTKDAEVAIRHLMHGMLDMLSANRVVWVAVARNKNRNSIPTSELLDEWYVLDLFEVSTPCSESDMAARTARYYKLKEKHGLDELTGACAKSSGKNRVQLRSDVLDDDAWENHWLMTEFREDLDYADVMHAITHIDDDCESYLVFYRNEQGGKFTEQDRLLAGTVCFGVPYLQRKLMALRGASLPSTYLLSAQERKVLKFFVEGVREKEIATQLGISDSAIRKHVSSIYRKFNVNGKFELFTAVCS